MTDSEARALCAEAQRGNVEAAQRLTAAHVRLCQLVAENWAETCRTVTRDHTVSAPDLAQEAAVILLEEVIPTYRTDGPVPFRSYARRKMNAGIWRTMKFKIRQRDLIIRAGQSLKQEMLDRQPESPEDSYYQNRVESFALESFARAREEHGLTDDHETVFRYMLAGQTGRAIESATGIPAKRVYYLISGIRAALSEALDYDY